MRQRFMMMTITSVLLIVGCSSSQDVQTVTLECRARQEKCFCFYSFSSGLLPTPHVEPDKVDIVYYYDRDDCSRGALFGNDDEPGYLFPIGHKSWAELAGLKPAPGDMETVVGILPLTMDKEGLAFWVKAADGQYFLARISEVRPASYSELIAGGTAKLKLQWSRPR